MKRLFFALGFCLVACVGCREENHQFITEGVISGAMGQMLYLEEVGTGDVCALDSIKLNAEGTFRFTHDACSYPMFYRLRLGDSSIPFFADSATHIIMKSTGQRFFLDYEIEEADQYNYQIRDIAFQRHRTDVGIDSVLALYTSGQLPLSVATKNVDSLAKSLKSDLTTRYIFVNPKSPSAYFALFQRKGDAPYYAVDGDGDERPFAAVATAYDTYYPDAPYTPFLKNLALKAIAASRIKRSWDLANSDTTNKHIRLLDYPNLNLPDRKGELVDLSSKVTSDNSVLLCFTSYAGEWSPKLVARLRQLQKAHPDLVIYEVSADSDDYFWRNATRTLPWITVRDINGDALRAYNVQSLPTFFSIKGGGMLKRIDRPEEVF